MRNVEIALNQPAGDARSDVIWISEVTIVPKQSPQPPHCHLVKRDGGRGCRMLALDPARNLNRSAPKKFTIKSKSQSTRPGGRLN